MSINKRIEKLEAAAKPKGKGFLLVFEDPDQDGVFWERSPLCDDKGRAYSQAEIDEYDPVLVVQYIDDWGQHER